MLTPKPSHKSRLYAWWLAALLVLLALGLLTLVVGWLEGPPQVLFAA